MSQEDYAWLCQQIVDSAQDAIMRQAVSQEGYAWLCQQIVDNAQDAIIFANRDGVIRLWNPGAVLLFGYTSAEAVGKSLDLIIPDNLRERHWKGFREAICTGITRYDQGLLAVPAVRKDGKRLSLELTVALIRDSGDALLGVAAIIRDVTVTWRAHPTDCIQSAEPEPSYAGPT